MNKYKEMKNRHQEEVNAFPLFFAFTDKTFDEKMIERGLDPDKDLDKVRSIGNGGFVLEKDGDAFIEMFKRHGKELEDAIAANEDNFIVDMFAYELANHEYCNTGDMTDTLNALSLTMEDVNDNKNLRKGLAVAIKQYMADCDC